LTPFKGAAVDATMLVTSSLGIRNNSGNVIQAKQVSSFVNGPDTGWDLLKDLGVNLIVVSEGREGDILHVRPNIDTYWAENLNAFLTKAASLGMKVAFHEMGGTYGQEFGIVAPMSDWQNVTPYTSVSDALVILAKMAGQNDLHHNFLADPRIAYWQPINEADVSVWHDWIYSVCSAIEAYGGKCTVCVATSAMPSYYQSFPDTISYLGNVVNYLQAHDYGQAAAETISAQGLTGQAAYNATYKYFLSHFQVMCNTRGTFATMNIFDSEVAVGCGTNIQDVAGNIINISDDQQSQFIKALFDACKTLDLGGIVWWHPIDAGTSPELGDFINYYGTITNPEAYATFKAATV
jgi:hypothetical protein